MNHTTDQNARVVYLKPTAFVAQDDQDISGAVTDEKGETLPGVSVVVKGSQQGATTDASGWYKLKVSTRNNESNAEIINVLRAKLRAIQYDSRSR